MANDDPIEVTVHGRIGSGPVDVRTLDAFCEMVRCVHKMIEDGYFSEDHMSEPQRLVNGREWRERTERSEAENQRLREALELIARGVWTAPNSIETIVYTARQALKIR